MDWLEWLALLLIVGVVAVIGVLRSTTGSGLCQSYAARVILLTPFDFG
jgi:hypothetical protein